MANIRGEVARLLLSLKEARCIDLSFRQIEGRVDEEIATMRASGIAVKISSLSKSTIASYLHKGSERCPKNWDTVFVLAKVLGADDGEIERLRSVWRREKQIPRSSSPGNPRYLSSQRDKFLKEIHAGSFGPADTRITRLVAECDRLGSSGNSFALDLQVQHGYLKALRWDMKGADDCLATAADRLNGRRYESRAIRDLAYLQALVVVSAEDLELAGECLDEFLSESIDISNSLRRPIEELRSRIYNGASETWPNSELPFVLKNLMHFAGSQERDAYKVEASGYVLTIGSWDQVIRSEATLRAATFASSKLLGAGHSLTAALQADLRELLALLERSREAHNLDADLESLVGVAWRSREWWHPASMWWDSINKVISTHGSYVVEKGLENYLRSLESQGFTHSLPYLSAGSALVDVRKNAGDLDGASLVQTATDRVRKDMLVALGDVGYTTRLTPLGEMARLTDLIGGLPEFASASTRTQLIELLPPGIQTAITEAATARLHIVAILRACARFGPAGRDALLDMLRVGLPEEDPKVRHLVSSIRSAAMFT